jgi:hypothetical protein
LPTSSKPSPPSDRPYKRGKTLSESLGILGKFKLNGHIDPDLFDVFVGRRSIAVTPKPSSTRSRWTRWTNRSVGCEEHPDPVNRQLDQLITRSFQEIQI